MGEDSNQNKHSKPLLVQLNGRLFDIAQFAAKHPGGEKVLKKLAGENVEEYMNGKKRILGVKHEHSEAAYNMLEKYDVKRYHKGDPILDSKRGVLPRVGSLGADYWTWIHQPYEGTIRLFDSDFMESLTRTAWYMVPLCWMPIVLFFGLSSLFTLMNSYGSYFGSLFFISLFVSGFLAWTLLEYSLHRHVFHWQPNPKSPNQLVLHFLLHGLHHKTPMDGDRLVFPPAPAALIIGFFYLIYSNILPWTIFCAYGSGKLFGYICYDMTHYYLHHGSPRPLTNMHFKKFTITTIILRISTLMYLRFYLDENNRRVYTLKKASPDGTETQSAHPARFSPEDKNSKYRIIIKKRFGLLPTQQAKQVY